MSDRGGEPRRRTSARHPRLLLVAGVGLVLGALAMSRCEAPEDILEGSAVIWAGPVQGPAAPTEH